MANEKAELKVVKSVVARPERPELHVACYGGPGTRKSTFFATFPQPIIVAHFDAMGKDMPYWELGVPSAIQQDKHGIEYREILGETGQLLCRIEYYHDPIVDAPVAATAFLERLNRLAKEVAAGKCKTFVLDTVTSASLKARKMYQYDLNPQSKDPRKWYGGAVDILEEILLIQLPGMTCNVCIGLHVSKVKIEAEGTMVRAPMLPGRLMESFSSQWPEVYRAYIERDDEGEKVGLLQTQGDEFWDAASQIRAPDPSYGEYAKLWKAWDKKRANAK
jgi:hypothetical protein